MGGHRSVALEALLGTVTSAATVVVVLVTSATLAVAEEGQWRFGEPSDESNEGQAATKLTDGRVLVSGGTEPDSASNEGAVYDPASDEWESTDDMNYGRHGHEMVALPDGRALMVGGARGGTAGQSRPVPAEIYDRNTAPVVGSDWTAAPPSPVGEIETATLLEDGRVLVTGARTKVAPADGEPAAALFDPEGGAGVGAWMETDAPGRVYGVAVRMSDGGVLVAGGGQAEVYSPSDAEWQDASANAGPAIGGQAPLLAGLDEGQGGALAVGGSNAALYNPDQGEWDNIEGPSESRRGNRKDAATRLVDGRILITGSDCSQNQQAELFDPDADGGDGSFVSAGMTAHPRERHTSTLLDDGRVLVLGGRCDASAELYLPSYLQPGDGEPELRPEAPRITEIDPKAALVDGGLEVTIRGAGFTDVENVTFGEKPAAFERRSHAEITATVPSHQRGTVGVRVQTPADISPPLVDAPEAAFTYVGSAGTWSPAGTLERTPGLEGPAAVRVGDGSVLALYEDEDGEPRADRYDPVTGTLESVADPPLDVGLAAPLSDGGALIVDPTFLGQAAAVYDPGADDWEQTPRPPLRASRGDTATLLTDGRVLVTASADSTGSQVYDPDADMWRTTVGQLDGSRPRVASTATRLADGRVLLAAGGRGDTGPHSDAQIFDPASEQWTQAAKLNGIRGSHTATRLDGGNVLVAGGNQVIPRAGRSAELFDVNGESNDAEGSWRFTASMADGRKNHVAARLADGSVLSIGGRTEDNDLTPLASVETYRPEAARWEPTASLPEPRFRHSAVALEGDCGSRCGSVLVVGGVDGSGSQTATLKLYTPRPRVDSVESARAPLEGGDQVTITGQFFAGVDSVWFGQVQSDDVEVISQTEIVAEVPPAGSNGPVPVTVTNDVPMGGGETEALASFPDEAPRFTYVSEAGRVDDLTGQAPAEGTVKLSWSAVDDGTASPADEYVVAQSVEPIEDADDFADAFALCGGVCDHFDPRPQAVGDTVTLTVEQLQPGTTYHYAVAPIDADDERGPISDAVAVTTLGTDSSGESPSDDDGTPDDGATEDGGTGDDITGEGTTEDDGAGGNGAVSTDHGTVDEAAEAGGGVVRLAGADRIATSVEASREAFDDGEAGAVVLARADEFADGLAGVPLARVVDGPLLLTHSGELDDRVAGELQRLLAEGDDVWILGGRAALSEQVEQRVAELGFEPQRLAGNDRFETAAVIAEHGLGAPGQILVATGGDFADAVTAGAAAAHTQGAVVLSAGDQLPAATSEYLAQHDPAEVFAVGGPAAAAVPDARPLAGASRFETAATVADQFFADPSTVGLATGARFPDALSGGSHIARYGGPMLLSGPDRLHNAAEAYMAGRAAAIDAGVIYGGTAALTSGVADGLATAITADS